MKLTNSDSPFVVPPFDGKIEQPIKRFVWWSWHPNYPRWAKSVWGGATEHQAREALNSPFAHSMRMYHNKLMRENDDHTLTEIDDVPCQEMEVWHRIANQRKANP